MWTSIKLVRRMQWTPLYLRVNAKSNAVNANLIKTLNHESKVLFGAVQKRKSRKKKIDDDSSKAEPANGPNSSENYWLFEHKPDKLRIKKILPNSRKTAVDEEPAKISRTKDSYNDLEKAVETKLSTGDGDKKGETVLIPFDEKDLKSILKFPLLLDEGDRVFSGEAAFKGRIPSVGQILQATMSEGARKALMKWKIAKIAELGEDGFRKLQQDHLHKGKLLHKSLQEYLLSDSPPVIEPEAANLWESVLPALETLKPKAQLVETPVQHPFLKYRGIVDCVSKIGDTMTVIEWKKSDKLKTTIDATHDAPIQLCAYLGALSADPRHRIKAKQGYVVVAYTDSKPAEVHYVNEMQLQKYWDIWLRKVQEFWIRTRDGTLPELI